MSNMQHCDKSIYKVAISIPVYRLFDYLAPEDSAPDSIKPGVRVEVPFGKGKKVGYVLEITSYSEFELNKLKPILRVIDPHPGEVCYAVTLVTMGCKLLSSPYRCSYRVGISCGIKAG